VSTGHAQAARPARRSYVGLVRIAHRPGTVCAGASPQRVCPGPAPPSPGSATRRSAFRRQRGEIAELAKPYLFACRRSPSAGRKIRAPGSRCSARSVRPPTTSPATRHRPTSSGYATMCDGWPSPPMLRMSRPVSGRRAPERDQRCAGVPAMRDVAPLPACGALTASLTELVACSSFTVCSVVRSRV
jgi:hypothetical protein